MFQPVAKIYVERGCGEDSEPMCIGKSCFGGELFLGFEVGEDVWAGQSTA